MNYKIVLFISKTRVSFETPCSIVIFFADDKSDPQSGSESCGSDDLSHQSSPNVSSSAILSAFTSHGKQGSHYEGISDF